MPNNMQILTKREGAATMTSLEVRKVAEWCFGEGRDIEGESDIAAMRDYILASIPPNPDEPVTADWLREEWGFESEDDANGLIMIGTLDSHFEIELINIGDGWLVGGCINFPNGITTRHQFHQLATVLGLKPKQPTN